MGAASWLSLAVFAATAWQLVALWRGLPQVPQLRDLPAAADGDLPAVSVVVSARDEAGTIEAALRSLLAQDVPRLEIVAIDDRSADGTGAILDRLAQADARLRVLHVRELPDGWLGKTHALHLGAQAATGDYLLFTDADVHFAPQALRRALACCIARRLDHLVVVADLTVRQPLLAALLLEMLAAFCATLPPWKVATSRRVYAGVGAFNLVRAAPYRRLGGHAALRLEVIDDMELGRLLKQAGLRQDLLFGREAVLLEWYADAAQLARGLEKNSFASVGYSVARAAAATLLVLVLHAWPLAALVVTSGPGRWLNLGSVACSLLLRVRLLRTTAWHARCLLWWPLAPLVLLGVLWRSVLVTLRRGGVVWRGTRYPLAQLRAARAARRRPVSGP
ncbi:MULTISPECIES: glycosyltransferase [Ramlibacter]|uniref:glycosyltransferase n=1 Tax=Ramlibacter TaxID=174951 RepID=UPI0012FAA172|nr:glycosyltransferase [Ramlibacter sp. CGMCC 1.13660]